MKNDDGLEYRKVLLDFYASQLSTHSPLIIGFAPLMLTLAEIVLRIDLNSSVWILNIVIPVRYVVYGSLFLTSSIFWYVFMRQIAYGVLAHCASATELHGSSSLQVVARQVTEDAAKRKFLGVIPYGWFISYGERKWEWEKIGEILVCTIASIVTTVILAILLEAPRLPS